MEGQPVTNLHIMFTLFLKTYGLLQILLNVTLECFITFLTKQRKT